MISPHNHTQEVTRWGDGNVNYLECGDYFTVYADIKSSGYTP